ncbi:MAG: hypothetical protein J5I98_02810 [Phaeodactylibacter sp.]|nr:hypothetical protein [Phaeodactylibacter sp.]
MYRSCEIRWFFSVAPAGLIAWFAEPAWFDSPDTPLRTDHYLLVADGENIGVKLREGNVEAKHRVATLGEWAFPLIGARGVAEHWIKWSFRLDEADGLSQKIIQEGNDNWVAVAKERLGYIYHFLEDGAIRQAPIGEWGPEGCQVEMTRIQVKGKTYHTFGLEAFSESGNLEGNLRRGAETAFSALREWGSENGWPDAGFGFGAGCSMGYPAFLSGL